MCKFCRYERLYFGDTHHELPPGNFVDPKITSRSVQFPSDEDYTFVMESMVASTNRQALTETKRYNFGYAANLLAAARECRPSDSKVYDFYALYYLQQEDLESALSSVKTALRLNNSNGESFLIAAQIYRQMHKYDMSLRALEIGLVCVPATAETADIRKSLSEEITLLKSEIPGLESKAEIPKTLEPTNAPDSPSLRKTNFLPSLLSITILEVVFTHMDYVSAKKMELVSKEWNQVVLGKEIQQIMLIAHTIDLISLLELPKDTFSLPTFNDAFKSWLRMEANARIRKQVSKVMIVAEEKQSLVSLFPPADFTLARYEVLKETLRVLPHYFLLLYSIHNGMKFFLRGAMKRKETYKCYLYPIDSPLFGASLEDLDLISLDVPSTLKSKVRSDCSKDIVIGKIKIGTPRHENAKAYDVWNDLGWDDEIKEPTTFILLDPSPLPEGTVGQLLLVEKNEVVDVLPGGIAQLLEFLAILDTSNLIATIGMFTRATSDNHLPETLEKSLSKLTPQMKPRKLASLFKKLKRYKSAYKGYQCTLRR